MGSYRKKPVVIEAVQLPLTSAPSWLADAMDAGTVRLFAAGNAEIDTLEGVMSADCGDWIICGIKGELYPCKPDIFAASYDPADAATSIERNQVLTPAQKPEGDEQTLERVDGAEDFENLGPPVVIAPYKRPRDKRVTAALDAADRQREAEGLRQAPRKIYTDPRLDPNYKPPKKPFTR
jgi:hypothetical protein